MEEDRPSKTRTKAETGAPAASNGAIKQFEASRLTLGKGLPDSASRRAAGRALRQKVPRSSHAEWSPPSRRANPVDVVAQTGKGRVEHLLPIRNGRMAESAFAFLRGSAEQMAADLASTPSTGLNAWLCGDAHLLNFGLYASPERSLVFDINDFDEVVFGPWEWDLKRLVASIEIAGRSRDFPRKVRREAVRSAVASYREWMSRFAELPLLELFSLRLGPDEFRATRIWAQATSAQRRRAERMMKKAERRTNDQALRRFATTDESGELKLVDSPPLLERVDRATAKGLTAALEQYAVETLSSDRQELLRSYVVCDVAFKVVGVGSVGTRAYLAMLVGNGAADPLFLQIKEAGDSALALYVKHGSEEHGGERVVHGQRRLQSVSDPFLGWTTFDERSYYVRQLRDMKGSVDIETMPEGNFVSYGRLCAGMLAKGHARTGDAGAIAGYCGNGDALDRALVEFARQYADQAESDHAAVVEAIAAGKLPAQSGV